RTGTDQFAIAARKRQGHRLTSASPHVKLIELIGRTVRDATLEGGMELSYTRSIVSKLGRFGLQEKSFFEDIGTMLPPQDLELMRRNSKFVFSEALVAACVYAFAGVLDRI